MYKKYYHTKKNLQISWNIDKDVDFFLHLIKFIIIFVLESLRKYPSLPFLDRICESDYKVPGTDLVIKKGLPVYISLLGIQNDEKYFPNPEKYFPERFKEKVNVDQLVHLPFGFGPRACIGKLI